MTTPQANQNRSVIPVWKRSSSVVSAAAVLFGIVLFSYAGATWPIVLHELLSDGLISVAWIVAAFGIGSQIVHLIGPCKEQDQIATSFDAVPHVTAIALGLGIIGLMTLGLGLAGAFNRGAAVGIILVGFIGCAIAYRRKQFDCVPAESTSGNGLVLFAMPFLAIAVMAAMVPPGLLWQPNDPHGYDVVSYHLQIPREWFEAGRITPLTHNVFSFFPFNVEMHYLLAMHLRGGAWAGMYLAQLMHLWFIVLTVIAIWAAAGPIAGVAAATLPWLAMLGSVAYNEGGLLLFGTLAIVWTIRSIDLHGGTLVRRMILAGVFAGLACGSKYTGVVAVGGIVMGSLVVLRGRAILPAAIFAIAALLTFSPWIIRNVAWTGNPVFPEAMPIFGQAHFSDTQVERWKRAHSPTVEEQGLVDRLVRARQRIVFDWQYGFVLLPLGVIAIGVAQRSRGVVLLAILLLVHAIFWLGFTHLQSRFFIPAIPIAAMLVGMVQSRAFRVSAGVIVGIASIVSFGLLHDTFHNRMTELQRFVGLERLDTITPVAVDKMVLPESTTLQLVGDAAAFFYPKSVSHLRYRTVFDVDAAPGQTAVEAWTRGWPAGEPRLIAPAELERFSKTYWGIPAPSAEVAANEMPYLVMPDADDEVKSP